MSDGEEAIIKLPLHDLNGRQHHDGDIVSLVIFRPKYREYRACLRAIFDKEGSVTDVLHEPIGNLDLPDTDLSERPVDEQVLEQRREFIRQIANTILEGIEETNALYRASKKPLA